MGQKPRSRVLTAATPLVIAIARDLERVASPVDVAIFDADDLNVVPYPIKGNRRKDWQQRERKGRKPR